MIYIHVSVIFEISATETLKENFHRTCGDLAKNAASYKWAIIQNSIRKYTLSDKNINDKCTNYHISRILYFS